MAQSDMYPPKFVREIVVAAEGQAMSAQQVNQITAIVALVLMVILFILVIIGVLPSLLAILLTLGIGLAVGYIRKTMIKP